MKAHTLEQKLQLASLRATCCRRQQACQRLGEPLSKPLRSRACLRRVGEAIVSAYAMDTCIFLKRCHSFFLPVRSERSLQGTRRLEPFLSASTEQTASKLNKHKTCLAAFVHAFQNIPPRLASPPRNPADNSRGQQRFSVT